VHEFLTGAFTSSGGRVLHSSSPTRAPVYIGLEIPEADERLGVLCYPFRVTRNEIRNRPADEHRLQIRYGSESTWGDEHPLGFDIAGIDTTLVLGVHPEEGIFVGLDPLLYDPLPMGISLEFKDSHVSAIHRNRWFVWERVNRPGRRRAAPRSLSGLETLVGFKPDQLVRYARFEREASALGLDPVLRMRAAQLPAAAAHPPTSQRHQLEATFQLNSQELLEIIANRRRLEVAVRGGVAEHHLMKALSTDPKIISVKQIDSDGPPDVEATLRDGRVLGIECKNGEEHHYSNGDGRVEVQKTRASKGDPASRYYEPTQFDVLAVCLWPVTGGPRFVYRRSSQLSRHPEFDDRLAALHRIDASWAGSLANAM
jgi:hypothetical protein